MAIPLMEVLMPTALIEFAIQPELDNTEAVYLVCPTPIPPSMALKFIREQAQKYLRPA